jgi:hypothetical protein
MVALVNTQVQKINPALNPEEAADGDVATSTSPPPPKEDDRLAFDPGQGAGQGAIQQRRAPVAGTQQKLTFPGQVPPTRTLSPSSVSANEIRQVRSIVGPQAKIQNWQGGGIFTGANVQMPNGQSRFVATQVNPEYDIIDSARALWADVGMTPNIRSKTILPGYTGGDLISLLRARNEVDKIGTDGNNDGNLNDPRIGSYQRERGKYETALVKFTNLLNTPVSSNTTSAQGAVDTAGAMFRPPSPNTPIGAAAAGTGNVPIKPTQSLIPQAQLPFTDKQIADGRNGPGTSAGNLRAAYENLNDRINDRGDVLKREMQSFAQNRAWTHPITGERVTHRDFTASIPGHTDIPYRVSPGGHGTVQVTISGDGSHAPYAHRTGITKDGVPIVRGVSPVETFAAPSQVIPRRETGITPARDPLANTLKKLQQSRQPYTDAVALERRSETEGGGGNYCQANIQRTTSTPGPNVSGDVQVRVQAYTRGYDGVLRPANAVVGVATETKFVARVLGEPSYDVRIETLPRETQEGYAEYSRMHPGTNLTYNPPGIERIVQSGEFGRGSVDFRRTFPLAPQTLDKVVPGELSVPVTFHATDGLLDTYKEDGYDNVRITARNLRLTGDPGVQRTQEDIVNQQTENRVNAFCVFPGGQVVKAALIPASNSELSTNTWLRIVSPSRAIADRILPGASLTGEPYGWHDVP